MLKLTLRHFGRFSVFKFLNLILSTLWSLFGFHILKLTILWETWNGLSVTRSFWVFCPIGHVWDRQPPLWWQAWSSMDITSHGAFFASTRNSWMGPFRPIFASVLFKLIIKKGTDQVQVSDLIYFKEDIHQSPRRPNTRSAHCRGKTPQMYKTKFTITKQVNKIFKFCVELSKLWKNHT